MGWGAVLRGDATDIDDWQYVLKAPFDPWVEVHGSDTILRSSILDSLSSAEEVRDHAVGLIARLNGAVALSEAAKPVSFDGVAEFTSDGRMLRHRMLAGCFTVRAKVRASLTVCGPDGQPRPTPPSEVQRWAEVKGFLGDALVCFGRADNWFDIYICLEYIKASQGLWRKLYDLNWAPKKQIELMKQTANWVRHAEDGKLEKPKIPMKIEEAQKLLALLLRRALAEQFKAGRSSGAS